MRGGTIRLAVVLHLLKDQPWAARVKRDIESVLASHPSIRAEYADPGGDAGEQVRLLETYLAQRVHALIVVPIDTASVQKPLRSFQDAKIPVIVIGADVGDDQLYQAQILGNQPQFGREVGSFFAEVMDGAGDIVEVLGIVASSVTSDRSKGFRQAIAGYPKMRIIDSCVGDWRHEPALREFTQVLARQPRIDGVFAHNDEMASAILQAASAVGREAEMLVAGIDALPTSIRLVSQGRLAATFLYPSPGKDAVYALLAILNGEHCLKRVMLQTWPFRSNSRIEAWKSARKKPGPSPRPSSIT
jgi:ribose transport system substrate-binding protein